MREKTILIIIVFFLIISFFLSFEIRKYNFQKVLIFVPSNNFNDMQFVVVYACLKATGFLIDVACPAGGIIKSDKSIEIKSDFKIKNAVEKDYISLVLIGGKRIAGLNENGSLKKLCKAFNNLKKILAAQGYGPLIF